MKASWEEFKTASGNTGENAPSTGHNSISAQALENYVKRIERLNEEKAALGVDISEVFKEAKGAGFDPKIMRQVIRIRAEDPSDRAEREALVEVYLRALGNGG